MKSKKLISTILALLLALQCIAPAFASEADVPPETGETPEETLRPETPEEVFPETPPEVLPEDPVPQEPEETQPPEDAQEPGEVQEPEDAQPPDAVQDQPEAEPNPEDVPDAVPLEDLIDVLVPSSGQIILNPYRLPVDLEGGETTDQIIHSCQTLINQSDFPVIVNVSVTGTVPAESEAAFVSEPPSPDAPDKEVFLYAEFQPFSDWWEGRFDDLPNQVLVSERGDAKEEVLTLDTQGEGYFRLFGEMSEAPEEMWSKTDVFGAVLAFTFTPVYMEPEPTEETEEPEDAEAPDTPPEELPEVPSTGPGMPDMPEEDPSEDPGAPEEPETPDTPEASDPSFPEETEPSEPPAEDPGPVPADPPEQDAPEPPEAPEETPPEETENPDVPATPEAPAEPDATLPAVQDNE